MFPDLSSRVVRHEMVPPGHRCMLPGSRLSVTGVPVVHCPGALIFVVESWTDHGAKKAVFCWDAARFTGPGNDPTAFSRRCNQNIDESHNLLYDPDLLVADAFTWKRHGDTNHLSIAEIAAWAKRWRAKRAAVIHYSGHADAVGPFDPANIDPECGPVASADLTRALERLHPRICVAYQGQRFCL